MTNTTIQSDIGFVKDLVSKAKAPSTPGSVYALWAVLVAVGFTMVDFAPMWVGFYWMIAGPGGGLLSGYLGSKAGIKRGQIDREVGIQHALHWSGMLVVTGLAVLLAVKGLVHGQVISQIILLIVALGWWSAGVLFDRAFLYLGGIMMLGFIATLFISKYAWTGMGILMMIALFSVAYKKGKRNGK